MSYTNQPDSTDLWIKNGVIQFDQLTWYRNRAEEAREYLMKLDVTPETEKECKSIVATARCISDTLNQEKIRIKKQILEPYMDFENKVKEIIGIISEGENVARDKLKAIDEQRREEKKEEIRKIWEKRSESFTAGKYFDFDSFLKDQHLNKTVSINEVEKEMVAFLVSASTDIETLNQMPLGSEYVEEYTHCLNALKAMVTVDNRHKAMQSVTNETYMVIRITGKADVILAKQLLKDVNYKVLEEK